MLADLRAETSFTRADIFRPQVATSIPTCQYNELFGMSGGMSWDPSFSAVELDFREVVREFLRRELPPHLSGKVRDGRRLSKQDMELWHRILSQQRWLATHWPQQYGGTGWSVVQR